jgi:hypothetical protein
LNWNIKVFYIETNWLRILKLKMKIIVAGDTPSH